jgi:5-dehydro-4-deoxyglucarate dehydratase
MTVSPQNIAGQQQAFADAAGGELPPLARQLGSGMLSFPVTCFYADGQFEPSSYQEVIRTAVSNSPAGLFVAGGTGEFFSLTPEEHKLIVKLAVEAAGGALPIIAGCGYGTHMAVQFAQAAEKAGAVGVLMLPQYLMNAEQEGLYRHVKTICDSVDIGVIVYNRDNMMLQADTLTRLAAECKNLIGFKDGSGNVEINTQITTLLRNRLVFVGGMPTAEIYAKAYHAGGFTTYSSAVFNFIPEMAQKFYAAIVAGDDDYVDETIKDFFIPFLRLRNAKRGYPVSIIKAGMRVMGFDPGPVRAPLTDLTQDEHKQLELLLKSVGA